MVVGNFVLRLNFKSMTTYIFKDLNSRDSFVDTSENLMLYDSKAVVQSIWRLITTEEGEIPNYRTYCLSLKRFMQYPLTKQTVNMIYEYIKGKIEYFESRAEIISAQADVNFDNGMISFIFYVQVKSTGEFVQLAPFSVQVAA